MKKIVRFPQIVQIIITPTQFALLWSVSEKVCLTKNTRTFVFEFLKDLSAQKQRVFQTNATLISTVRKTHAERYLCEIAVQIRNLKKRYSCCVLSLLFWELNSLFRLCFKRNVLLLNKKSIFIYLVRRFAINGQKSDFQRSRFSDFFFTFGLLHFYSANIRYNNSRNNNAFPFFSAKRMQRLFPTRYKHKQLSKKFPKIPC